MLNDSDEANPETITRRMRKEKSMVYREQLSKICKDLKRQRHQFIKEREKLPEGYLNIRTYKGSSYYTWQIPKGGRRKKIYRKGISKDKEQINKLVRKRYLNKAIHNIEEDILLMERTIAQYKDIDEGAVMGEYLQKHPELAGGLRYGNVSNEEWASDYKQVLGLYKENLKMTSSSGTKMRSYGELLIASRLEFYGIPFRYEEGLHHPGVRRVPDFTIRRPKDGKIFYWEHLGMVTNGSYIEKNISKLKEYEAIGITPWDNLIITFGQADGGMDVKKIDAIIQGWLL